MVDWALKTNYLPTLFTLSVEGSWQTTPKGMKVNLRRVGSGPFGYELSHVLFTIEEYGNDVMRFKVHHFSSLQATFKKNINSSNACTMLKSTNQPMTD